MTGRVVSALMALGAHEVGGRITAAREARRLTKEQLASRAGVTTRTIYRLERGVTRGHARTLRQIAAALNIDADELLGPTVEEVAGLAGRVDSVEAAVDALRRRVADLERIVGSVSGVRDYVRAFTAQLEDADDDESRPPSPPPPRDQETAAPAPPRARSRRRS
jgi:transcriptional regulator with XRE-family HTH domain